MKARDLIPGWPRGRSTSRPYAKHPPAQFCCPVSEQSGLDFFSRWNEWEAQQAEERRKADMMEAWYAMERRMREGGILYAKPPGERAIAAMVALLDLVERTK